MKTVLIVDDEVRLIESIKAGLKIYKDQFNVVTAYHGEQAVDRLKKHDIDLVVTDLKMPEMDGFELLAHICTEFPFIPAIVMTAFSTPDIETRLKTTNSLKVLEKPIDFDELADAIMENLEEITKEYAVAGFSLASFMQLLGMEQKTSLLNVKSGKDRGYVYFRQGRLFSAVTKDKKGEEAVFEMLTMKNIEILIKKLPRKKIKKNIDQSLMSILMESAKREDDKAVLDGDNEVFSEDRESMPSGNADIPSRDEDNNKVENTINFFKGDNKMGKIEESLEKFKDVEGFMAVGIFSPNGEMAAEVNNSGMKLDEIGALANDVLLKAQKATDLMDVGRGKTVHVDAPKAHIIARCFNENKDFSTTEAGKAHLHLVLIIDKDGNLAMAKMKIDSIINEVASAFR